MKYSLISLFLLILYVSDSFADQKEDIYLLKETNKVLTKIENTALKDRNKIDKLIISGFSSKDMSPSAVDKRGLALEKLVTNITNTLKSSMDITVPDIENKAAKEYITKAIDAHKHWAAAQQGRLAALLQFNSEDMEKFNDESDHYALIEGSLLVLADESVK